MKHHYLITMQVTGAILCGLLLSLSFTSAVLIVFIPVIFCIIFRIIGEGLKKREKARFLVFFIISFISAQYSFVWNSLELYGLEILAIVFPLLLYLVPCFCLCFRRHRVEIFILLWLCVEFWFSHTNIGNPFLVLGLIGANVKPLVQWVEYTGMFPVSFWLLSISYILYRATQKKSSYYLLIPTLVLPLVVSLFIPVNRPENETKVPVGIISLDDSSVQEDVYKLINPEIPVRYIIAPEGTFLLYDYHIDHALFFQRIENVLQSIETRPAFFAGIYTLSRGNQYSNALITLHPEKDRLIRYKQKLVPFSEFIPPVIHRLSFGRLDKGLHQPVQPIQLYKNGADTLSVLICYESLFTDIMIEQVQSGSQMFLIGANFTLDSKKRMNHLYLNVLSINSMITRRSQVIASYDGVSALVNVSGKQTVLSDQSTGYFTAEVVKSSHKTFYVRYGNWIDRAYMTLLILLLVNYIYKRCLL